MIKCEHCGDYPHQKCADCKAQFSVSEPPVVILDERHQPDYCAVCRNLRPNGCPGCAEGGENVVSLVRSASGRLPYVAGCVARIEDKAFLSNPYQRGTVSRDAFFNGWLDTNDRLGDDLSFHRRVDCPCRDVSASDARIIELLRS